MSLNPHLIMLTFNMCADTENPQSPQQLEPLLGLFKNDVCMLGERDSWVSPKELKRLNLLHSLTLDAEWFEKE